MAPVAWVGWSRNNIWHAAAALVAMSSMAMNKLTVICFFVVCYSHAAW
jgi:hypothetical protein